MSNINNRKPTMGAKFAESLGKDYSEEYQGDLSKTSDDSLEDLPKSVKKGNKPMWRPASKLGFLKVPKGYVGRWCSGDEADIQRKLAEGWIVINKTNCPSGEHVKTAEENSNIHDTNSLDSAVRYREMVGMMLPEELKKQRDEYLKNENTHQLRSRIMAAPMKEEMGKHASAIKSYITID